MEPRASGNGAPGDPARAAHDETRAALHRVAAHVLGRRRFAVTGRFGLRATPGGFGTPAFGEGPETVRVAGLTLVREVGGDVTSHPIPGSTLRRLAGFVDQDVDEPFAAGGDTPAVGDPDEPLDLDGPSAWTIAEGYQFGWRVLDAAVALLTDGRPAATVQLWPEHFDVGTTVGLPNGERVNLGFSPGDLFENAPYLYVGPWSSERPGDGGYWNAPFGALARAADLASTSDPDAAALQFVQSGLSLLSSLKGARHD